MRFCSLGSGSSGNATLVEVTSGGTAQRLLIDCGLPLKLLTERLAQHGLSIQAIDAVFITHEHSDHVGCARQLAVHHQRPIWMSRGTYGSMGSPDLVGQLRFACDDETVNLGSLQIHPFTVAHDAQEPLQLTVMGAGKRLGVLTDVGHVTPHITRRLHNLDALILEFNHDAALLQASKYPAFLKQRIAGDYGHLSNGQAGELLRALIHPGLQHIVAAHLSEQNNAPHLVRQVLESALAGHSCQMHIADAQLGCDWIET